MRPLIQRWNSIPAGLRKWLPTVLGLLALAGYVLWQYQQPGGAALRIHNHTERPIFSYWVNDNWGGNAFAHGGGKVTCCWRIRGDTLKVVWIVSRTRTQAEQGLEEERHELQIPNPPRERLDDSLHVHFLPGNQVEVAWSRTANSPLADKIAERLSGKTNDE